jgi:hypothetical protein
MAVPSTGAQTIADYSRAQRMLLENTMAQAAARSAGLGASAPAATASAAVVTPLLPAPRLPTGAPRPVPQVSGVFASADGVVAEVVVNATAYLLAAGQGVPGTAWQVESVAIDRVVLGRHAGADGDPPGTRKSFLLPAMR